MALVWNPFGAYSLGVAVIAWTLAAFVFSLRPARTQNRLLALALLFEGAYIACGTGLIYLTDDPRTVAAFQLLVAYAYAGFIAAYLALLGTLASPLSRPFATTWGRRGLAAAALAVSVLALFEPQRFVSGVRRVDYAALEANVGPAGLLFLPAIAIVFLYALVVAYDAWRRAPRGSMSRRQAGYFLLAFGVRDAIALADRLPRSLELFAGGVPGSPVRALFEALGLYGGFWFPTHVLLFVLLLAYAIVKVQLFDIDLKLKFALRQGTVAAILVATFFVVSEGLATLLSEQLGTFLGIATAGALLLFLAPLQRLAERLSDAAMPGVDGDDPDYVLLRKRDVYRAALEGAAEDGEVTARERRVLEKLQMELGLATSEVRTLERGLAGRT